MLARLWRQTEDPSAAPKSLPPTAVAIPSLNFCLRPLPLIVATNDARSASVFAASIPSRHRSR